MNDDARQKAEKLVDFIIASDRLEGIETPPEDREILIKIALSETSIDEYIETLSAELRERAKMVRATTGTSYQPSDPRTQQPHPRFTPNKDVTDDKKA